MGNKTKSPRVVCRAAFVCLGASVRGASGSGRSNTKGPCRLQPAGKETLPTHTQHYAVSPFVSAAAVDLSMHTLECVAVRKHHLKYTRSLPAPAGKKRNAPDTLRCVTIRYCRSRGSRDAYAGIRGKSETASEVLQAACHRRGLRRVTSFFVTSASSSRFFGVFWGLGDFWSFLTWTSGR